jgi:hypothetical protein
MDTVPGKFVRYCAEGISTTKFGWLNSIGSAPACHGKLSGLEFRHASKLYMNDISKGVANRL